MFCAYSFSQHDQALWRQGKLAKMGLDDAYVAAERPCNKR